MDNIKPLIDRKATSIPIRILKEIKKTVSEPLANLINLSITSIFPSVTKIGKILSLNIEMRTYNVTNLLLKNSFTIDFIYFLIRVNISLILNFD